MEQLINNIFTQLRLFAHIIDKYNIITSYIYKQKTPKTLINKDLSIF